MAIMVLDILLMAAAFAPAVVEGHGWLQQPLARQFCNGDEMRFSVTPSAGNGAAGMGGGGMLKLGGKPGLCGDPFEKGDPFSNFEDLPCQPQAVYQEGGILEMEVDIIANHGGFWEVSICDSKEISQDCFDANKLLSVEHNSEQWYMTSFTKADPDVRDPEVYKMQWKLPPGLTCEHCVVQWSWWTATHCVYPCDKAVCGFYADRLNKIVKPDGTFPLPYCETRYPVKGQKPQMFVNCADIKITGRNGGSAVAPTTSSNGGGEASAGLSSLKPQKDQATFVEQDDGNEKTVDMAPKPPAKPPVKPASKPRNRTRRQRGSPRGLLSEIMMEEPQFYM